MSLYMIIGGVVSALGLMLTAFFMWRKDGIAIQQNKDMKQEIAQDDGLLDFVRKEKDFTASIAGKPIDPKLLDILNGKK